MSIPQETKSRIVEENRLHDGDTGSAEVQIALLTARINELSGHFKTHAKDFASRRGLLKMVSKRNRLLRYLSRTAPDRYRATIARLGLPAFEKRTVVLDHQPKGLQALGDRIGSCVAHESGKRRRAKRIACAPATRNGS